MQSCAKAQKQNAVALFWYSVYRHQAATGINGNGMVLFENLPLFNILLRRVSDRTHCPSILATTSQFICLMDRRPWERLAWCWPWHIHPIALGIQGNCHVIQ